MKLKTLYLCQNCSFQSSKWAGKCPQCEAWNSFVEDVVNVGKPEAKSPQAKRLSQKPKEAPKKLSAAKPSKARIQTNIQELDQVLGGGIVEGSLILLSGEPGIGKSTLTMQIVNQVAQQKEKALYITGEESIEQVSDRAKRLNCQQENIELLYENSLENILATLESNKPNFLVLDSIQVIASEDISSPAGSLSQVRYVTECIMNHIKSAGIPTLLIGHVNKDGKIAGPKVLEHLVDTVLLLEGERDRELRMLRAMKNRFGSISEVGLFEMDEEGLKEVSNPGARLLENRPEKAIGTALTMTLAGNRPLLMEVQALVSRTPFGYPKRAASGFDRNRLELLIAVLEKHTKLSLADQDVYINIVGGLTLKDPSADLAICAAICSSLQKNALPKDQVFMGEVSLTGDLRPPFRLKERQKAIEKLQLSTPKLFKRINELV